MSKYEDKPILFLDVDGVLNCREDFENQGTVFALDSKKIARLKNIVEETGCRIVLSSNWRHSPKCMKVLESRLDEFNLHVSEMTQTAHVTGLSRGIEIDIFMANRKLHDCDTPAIALDDSHDIMENMRHAFPVLTSMEEGLTDERMDYAIMQLKKLIQERD